jgi:hypothetical protein
MLQNPRSGFTFLSSNFFSVKRTAKRMRAASVILRRSLLSQGSIDVDRTHHRARQQQACDSRSPEYLGRMPTLEPLPSYFFPYEAPFSRSSFPYLSINVTVVGLIFLSWFLTLQVTPKKNGESPIVQILKELTIALVAAILLGIGGLFMCLWVGIYV